MGRHHPGHQAEGRQARTGEIQCVLLLLLGLRLICFGNALAGSPWYFFYEKALLAQERGEWETSIRFLKDAIADNPTPRLRAKTYGLRFVNYLPYFRLGVAYYNLKEKEKALTSFAASEKFGEIQKAEEEYATMQRIKTVLSGAVAVKAQAPDTPAVATETSEQNLPWYVNYETGLAYVEAGDWFKAVEHLKWAVASSTEPKRYARTYGMWFISYFPYYYLGVAYYNQGLWQPAVQNLEQSERLGELEDLTTETGHRHTLLEEARKKNATAHTKPSPDQLKGMVSREINAAIRLFNLEEYAESETRFRGILNLDPYNSVARSYLKQIAAKTAATKPEASSNNDYMAGMFEYFKGNYSKAITLLRSAQREYGEVANFHAYLGAAYASRYFASPKKNGKSLVSARSSFTHALQLNPGYELDGRVFPDNVVRIFQDLKKGSSGK